MPWEDRTKKKGGENSPQRFLLPFTESNMELDEFNKLEEKVKNLVSSLKQLKNENQKLKTELDQLLKDSSTQNVERAEIKKKVAVLLDLIDSLDH